MLLPRIRKLGEYHRDLHGRNIIVRRHGPGFAVKLLGFYDRGGPRHQKRAYDAVDPVRLLHDSMGERGIAGGCPPEIRAIRMGPRSDLIRRRFPSATRLRAYVESIDRRSSRAPF